MIDEEKKIRASEQKERVRQRIRTKIDRNNYEFIPQKKQTDYYDNDVQQRVAVYARVSTGNIQQTTSYELQKKYYEDFVIHHPNWTLVKIYADEGISGTSLAHRVEFNRMIEDCRAGKIDTNIEISNRRPEDYFPVYQANCPGAMESHWVPNDAALWKIENYEEFLAQRRVLLAKAANELLASLYKGDMAETALTAYATKQFKEEHSEENDVEEMSAWMASHGLNEGTANHELLGDDGQVVAIIDLAWPQGVQNGLSEPLALILNESAETQATVSKHGYRYYTSVSELKLFIESVYLGE